MKTEKILSILLPGLLLFFYALFLVHPINLMTADLGRHLQNGRELIENHHLLTANFYSYTHPDFPVTNHHWGSGALFYLIFKVGGFVAVQAFFIAVALAAFFIFFRVAAKRGGLLPASLLSLLAIPLLGQRAEVRPEIVSYLLAGIFFWILLEKKYLWLLPAIEILWVNSHIYFFLGPALIGAFWLASFFPSPLAGEGRVRGKLTLILLATVLATLVNPFFLRGAIAPFTIWQNFGYNLAENQTLWNIERLLPGNPNYLLFKIVLGLLVASFVYAYGKRKEINWALLFTALGLSVMGLLQLRNFALFGLFALAITSLNLNVIASEAKQSRNYIALACISLALLLALTGELSAIFPQLQGYRLGLAPGVENAANYFKAQNIKGPIFNNYDVGSYLIYEIPQKVFVDNRPEAYPASFFRDTYIPMQENEDAWQEKLAHYDFHSIFFWRNDYTPWGQTFLQNRMNDPEWQLKYADDYAVILVRSLPSSPGEGRMPAGQERSNL